MTDGFRILPLHLADCLGSQVTESELATRIGLPLLHGVEDCFGPWAAIGGRLPSGYDVEYVCYTREPNIVWLRADKNAPYSEVLDEALQLVQLTRSQVEISPLVAT